MKMNQAIILGAVCGAAVTLAIAASVYKLCIEKKTAVKQNIFEEGGNNDGDDAFEQSSDRIYNEGNTSDVQMEDRHQMAAQIIKETLEKQHIDDDPSEDNSEILKNIIDDLSE